MTMTRHHGGECGKGPYHSPPCDPADGSVDGRQMDLVEPRKGRTSGYTRTYILALEEEIKMLREETVRLQALERVINQWLAPENSVGDLWDEEEGRRAMWLARDCLYSYLKYGDWDEQTKYGTQAAFDALTEVLVPDEPPATSANLCCDGLDGLHHEDCPNDR